MKTSEGLRSAHLEHCGRFQQKYQQDADLLEDIRTFIRQRSVIEKAYAQSLLKLSQQMLSKLQLPAGEKNGSSIAGLKLNKLNVDDSNGLVYKKNASLRQKERILNANSQFFYNGMGVKKGFDGPDSDAPDFDGSPSETAYPLPDEEWEGWIVLDETEKVGNVRLVSAETYLQKIADDCKQVRMARSRAVKTVLERLGEMQKEVTLTVQELVKAQKIYREEQHVTNEARLKASSADTKLKNRSISRFTSLNKLQQQSAKCNARWDACEAKSVEARNEYLLNLAATNTHLSRYYKVDMPDLLKFLDGDYYEKVQEFLSSLSHMEQSCANVTRESFALVENEATKISRDYDVEYYLSEKPALTALVQYEFEPQDNDPVCRLTNEYDGGIALSKEARKWTAKVVRETRTASRSAKELNKIVDQSRSTKTIESSLAIDAKCEELQNTIRRAETAKQRAEARLELLRASGVNVDEWINSALVEEADEGVEDTGRCSPSLSATSDNSDLDKFRSSLEIISPDTAPLPNRRTSLDAVQDLGDAGQTTNAEESYPVWCVALYDYQAVSSDELTIYENDSLQVIGTADSDGWLKARSRNGDEGFVPENYIRFWNPVDDSGEFGGNEVNVDDNTSGIASLPVDANGYPEYSGGNIWARALFDYEAACDEELSFSEGQLILVRSKDHDGVDDGWWIGELNSTVGVFPSLMVEELLPMEDATPDTSSLNDSSEYNSTRITADYHENNNKVQAGAVSRPFKPDASNRPHVTSQLLPSSGHGTRSALDLQYLFTDGAESSV